MSANENKVEDHAQNARHNTLRGNVRWPKNIYEVLYAMNGVNIVLVWLRIRQSVYTLLWIEGVKRWVMIGECGRQRLTCQAQLLFPTSGGCGGAGEGRGPRPPRVRHPFGVFRTVFYFVGTWNICVENLHRLVCACISYVTKC